MLEQKQMDIEKLHINENGCDMMTNTVSSLANTMSQCLPREKLEACKFLFRLGCVCLSIGILMPLLPSISYTF